MKAILGIHTSGEMQRAFSGKVFPVPGCCALRWRRLHRATSSATRATAARTTSAEPADSRATGFRRENFAAAAQNCFRRTRYFGGAGHQWKVDSRRECGFFQRRQSDDGHERPGVICSAVEYANHFSVDRGPRRKVQQHDSGSDRSAVFDAGSFCGATSGFAGRSL